MSIERDRKCIIAIIRTYEKSVLRDKHVGICYGFCIRLFAGMALSHKHNSEYQQRGILTCIDSDQPGQPSF